MYLTGLTQQNTWQIATGDGSRSYGNVFFELGIACLGPGDPGPWLDPSAMTFYNADESAKYKVESLSQVEPGEWVIARKGTQTILGVGKVKSSIKWSRILEDVDGWDLQHYVDVEWYRPATPQMVLSFSDRTLPWHTISGCNDQRVYQAIERTQFERVEPSTPISGIAEPTTIQIASLSKELLNRGVRVQDAENVIAAIERIERLTRWYLANDPRVGEAEIRAFLVAPLLVALGWPEQRIKLEYDATDVALFRERFNRKQRSSPEWIVEVKSFGNGLAFTKGQLKKYGKRFPNCTKFIATNGYRYVFLELEGSSLKQRGYFNLLNMRDRNVLHPEGLTPVETLSELSRFN